MRITTILLILVLTGSSLFAQNDRETVDWPRLELNILNNKNLADTKAELLQIRGQAARQKDIIAIARSVYLVMMIDDKRTEDSLFFINAASADSILSSDASPALSAVMNLVNAKRMLELRDKIRRTGNGKVYKFPDSSYRKIDYRDADSISNSSFDMAIRLASYLDSVNISRLLWLARDPMIFLYKARFLDIVYSERIFSTRQFSEPVSLSVAKQLFPLPPDELMMQPDTAVGNEYLHQYLFRLYKEWAAHNKAEPAAFYFIEEMARKNLLGLFIADADIERLYEAYLQDQLASPYGGVKAFAVLQLAERWVKMGDGYNPYINYNYGKISYDTSVRLHNIKAFELIRKYRPKLDSFGVIQYHLDKITGKILAQKAEWGADQKQLPGEPVLTFLKYKNIQQLFVRITRVNSKSPFSNPGRTEFRNNSVSDTVFSLPVQQDYQWHVIYLKLGPLPAGRYHVFYSNQPMRSLDTASSFMLEVSNIAVLNNDQRIFILNRKTGFPLEHAKVLVDGKPGKLNASGYLNVKDPDARIEVVVGNDTVSAFPNDPNRDLPNEIYNKEDYDNLQEYYEENIKVRFFTDRAIYRPGQTVYYKGIFMIPDIRTGKNVVLNWKNLKFPFMKKLFYKVMLKFEKERMSIAINDAFGHEFKKLEVFPDQFGAVSGSFVLPKNAATGKWGFDMEDIDVDFSFDGSFQVEEYKRPSFELTIEKPTGILKPGDDLPVVIRVRSFAGAKLENVLLKYSVTATGYVPGEEGTLENRTDTLLVSSGRTDNKGTLNLVVTDSDFFRNLIMPDDRAVTVSYNIYAEAIDNTGESYDETSSIALSSWYVTVKAQIPQMIDRSVNVPYYVSTSSAFAGEVKRQVKVRLSRIRPLKKEYPEYAWFEADSWLYPINQLQELFGQVDLRVNEQDKEEQRSVVFETMINTGADEKLRLPDSILIAGRYAIEFSCVENGRTIGQLERSFEVLDSKDHSIAAGKNDFHYMPANSQLKGKSLSWFTGNATDRIFSIYHLAYFDKSGKKLKVKNVYDLAWQEKGVTEWKFLLPSDVVGLITLTHQYIKNNHLYFKQEIIYPSGEGSSAPELVVEKYRTKLKPGEKEVFKVSLRTKDAQKAGQLMTTMYDASLDKLVPHEWNAREDLPAYKANTSWVTWLNGRSVSRMLEISETGEVGNIPKPVWWSDIRLNEEMSGLFSFVATPGSVQSVLSGRLPGVEIATEAYMNFDNVVVVGYGRAKAMMSAESIQIRGATSLSGYNKLMVVLDGNIIETDISKIDINTIIEGIVLKGADATALYGSRAASGVLLLSTKGRVQIPAAKEEPVQIRKNFTETAFFYPKIQADRKGWFTINFTLPESVTEWKWKMLAHTKKGAFAYGERTISSQLPMMVQPDMPRFLYQGDRIVLKTRISNLDSNDVSGIIKCVIEDMVTGEDISAAMLSSRQQKFAVKASGNEVSAFRINVPDTMIHPLRIRIVASGKNVSDGEEHIIPVLSAQTLVAQSVPLTAGELIKPALPADAAAYGVSVYIQPKPVAGLLNALPYLANYTFNCTEQTFNKILASAAAIKMMRTNDMLRQSFLDKQSLPAANITSIDSLAEGRGESMPWLQLEFAIAQHQRQLYDLLDTVNGKKRIKEFMRVIRENQQQDGGLSWFKGGKSDRYISVYLLAAAGKMKQDSLLFLDDRSDRRDFDSFIERLIRYCGDRPAGYGPYSNNIEWLYARSYWLAGFPLSESQPLIDSVVSGEFKRIDSRQIGEQAMLISAALRLYSKGDSFYTGQWQLLNPYVSRLSVTLTAYAGN